MNPTILICPICGDKVEKLVYRFHLGSERQVIDRIRKNKPEWTASDGTCSRCIDYYHTEIVMQQRILPGIGPHFPVKSADDFIILPTGLRLDADPRYTGKGITICFIDSGFYRHPDLVSHSTRIKITVDITQQNKCISSGPEAGHGTMTSVVCSGDGFLSNGLYKGIASDAELVLLKVQNNEGHITTQAIVNALKWVDDHHAAYDIRIVNMSIGDDQSLPWQESEVSRLAEKLIAKGIVIVAAAGNDENGSIKPPANAPNVITVGGTDDENKLDETKKLYHSSHNKTTDEIRKPELAAPAIWIAAPILPETKEEKEATLLYDLLKLPDELLTYERSVHLSQTGLEPILLQNNDAAVLRENILLRIQTCKYISPHYMHVDGTSFAAPIVSSVIAQLLEANSRLTPAMIREVIFSTAKRIKDQSAERQGFGVIQPRKALLKVLNRGLIPTPLSSPWINNQQQVIGFYVHHDTASEVVLSGTFNQWAPDVLQMEPGRNGLWKIEIPLLPPGRYYYKFCVDETNWIEDVNNPFREPDGFSGFNSVLTVTN